MTVRVTSAVWNQTKKPKPAGMLVMLALSDNANDDGFVARVDFDELASKCGVSVHRLHRVINWLQCHQKIVIRGYPEKTSIELLISELRHV